MNTRFDPELSRLSFEDRLIEFCEDRGVPLLERVRLLAITADRLDVFFATRVGRIKRLVAGGEAGKDTGENALDQENLVAVEAHRVTQRASRLLADLLTELEGHGITIENYKELSDVDRGYLRGICRERLDELVRPVVVGRAQLFPHVRNLRPALLAEVRRRGQDDECMLIAELPAELPRLVPLETGHRFVPLEQIIRAELPAICDDLEIGPAYLFRVTRNGDMDFSAEDDMLESVEQQIVWRPFQDIVRIEVENAMPVALRERLLEELQREAGTPGPGLNERDVYVTSGLIDMTALHAIADLDLPALKKPKIERRTPSLLHMIDGPAKDVLLHFPYDDYESSLEQLLAVAARHPELESMRTTIYRTDEDSDVVRALRTARTRGADVTAVVEVKASYNERDNIEWARMLDAEGVRVVLSPADLKVHAKTALVTFREGHVPRRIALVGTGNMNADTAKAYVDLWLATSDPERTEEVASVFDTFEGQEPKSDYRKILVSPFVMRERFLKMIEREIENARAGKPTGIRAMVNGLSDDAIIAALHRASQAGVRVDLVVRGVNLLRPGVPGQSENIRIVSQGGLLLQHARIFHFVNAGNDEWFIGSADWRPRNLERRVEVITDVTEPAHQKQLDEILTVVLEAPDAWVLDADGEFRRRGPSGQPDVRQVGAQLDAASLAKNPLRSDADVQPAREQLLQANPRAEVGARRGAYGASARAADVPRDARIEEPQQADPLEERD